MGTTEGTGGRVSDAEQLKSYNLLADPDALRQAVSAIQVSLREAGDDVSLHWASIIEHTLAQPAEDISLKQWMRSHHDEPIDTMRALLAVHRSDTTISVELREISGMGRRVDAERKKRSVFLGETRLWYAGFTPVVSTKYEAICVAPYGDDLLSVWVFDR